MELFTKRLYLRKLKLTDAPFILTLVNEPGWLTFIGDRNIHTISDAEDYIKSGPLASHAKHGFGLLLIQDRSEHTSYGLAGLLQREYLDAPDLGFALLDSAEGYGYAYEASKVILSFEFDERGRKKIYAFTKPNNLRSQRLLTKLGFNVSTENDLIEDDNILYQNTGTISF